MERRNFKWGCVRNRAEKPRHSLGVMSTWRGAMSESRRNRWQGDEFKINSRTPRGPAVDLPARPDMKADDRGQPRSGGSQKSEIGSEKPEGGDSELGFPISDQPCSQRGGSFGNEATNPESHRRFAR